MNHQLHPTPQPGDYLPLELEDPMEYLEKGDYVEVRFAGAAEPVYGHIHRVRADIQWALVESWNGSLRWAHVDDLRLILKAAALTTSDKSRAISA